MIIDAVSDLHGHYPELEGGDLLIIAGDLLANGDDLIELQYAFEKEWLRFQALKYKKVIIVAGNHDNIFTQLDEYGWTWRNSNVEYLCDSGAEFEGLKIWGSPWTMSFKGMNPHCMAFTCKTDDDLVEKWKLIPDDIDILITHSPPYGIMDEILNYHTGKIENVGSKSLAHQIKSMKIRPKIWIWGHIHECYGFKTSFYTQYINASHVNEHYKPVNKPFRIEFPSGLQ